MEDTRLYAALCVLVVLALQMWLHVIVRRRNLPPGPPALPIIGHLHLVKQPLHRALYRLSQKYGPIMSLRFGSRLVVVVSTPSAVEECLSGENDVIFANRPQLQVGKHLHYDYSSMVFAPFGDHWRRLRRLGSTEVFSGSRINAFMDIRRDEIMILLRSLYQISSHQFARVKLRPFLNDLTFNNVIRMIAGKRFFGQVRAEDYEESKKVQALIQETFEYAQANSAEDYLPFLRMVGYRKTAKKLAEIGEAFDAFIQGLINENRGDRGRNTMINHLLSLQELQPHQYSDEIIKGLVNVIVSGGTDTSVATTEWAMALLLNHPNVLKARTELEAQVGSKRLVEESDLSKLPYLNCIVSETLRLYPVIPSLVPHLASRDCRVGGYKLPRGTILIANAWAIHRDPETYEKPSDFKPERFEGGGIQAPKHIPFGMGRRVCPGLGLGQRLVGLTLGSLIQCFAWKRVSDEAVDLMEASGLTMPMASPLEAMCKACDITKSLFADA